MQIGRVYEYKKAKNSVPKLVYIISGSFHSNGRLCNYWTFKFIDEDGFLSGISGDYDNTAYKFKRVKNYRVKIQILFDVTEEK